MLQNFTTAYGISILLVNLYIYIILLYTFFNVLFLFRVEKIISINILKSISKFNFVLNTFFLIILSMAGVPPLLGFLSKFLVFNFLFYKSSLLLIIIFSFMNFFSIYFYIQNIKFLIKKNFKNFFFFKKL